jgi:hypothetical protein
MSVKFSLGYPQFTKDPSYYYTLLKNSSQEYKDEISDIYFSVPFKYDGVSYGDCMSATSLEEHTKYLLKINNELNVKISLTFNEIPADPRIITTPEIFDAFIEHLRYFYDNGVRMCTISDTHMMSTGRLQHEFPEMHWKNTVNHLVDNAQSVLDYHLLGYNTILLDRSLNRNLPELKAIKRLQERYNNSFKTSLLVTESCLPSCPFKTDHDSMGSKYGQNLYWSTLGNLSCTKWRSGDWSQMPRIGTDLIYIDEEGFNEFAELVDVFKYTGRVGNLEEVEGDINDYKFVWGVTATSSSLFVYSGNNYSKNDLGWWMTSNTHSDILKNKLTPLNNWSSAKIVKKDFISEDTWKYKDRVFLDNIWATKKGKSLAKILKDCKNQCWDCHACEKVFNTVNIDSIIQINRENDNLININNTINITNI